MNNWNQRILLGKVGKHLTGFTNIRIDRATPLGNPYIMYRSEQRDEVCDGYEKFLAHELEQQENEPLLTAFEDIFNAVADGQIVNLQCHCSPERCHGESIRDQLIKYLEEHEIPFPKD